MLSTVSEHRNVAEKGEKLSLDDRKVVTLHEDQAISKQIKTNKEVLSFLQYADPSQRLYVQNPV